MKIVRCFICNKDISRAIKVKTFHSYSTERNMKHQQSSLPGWFDKIQPLCQTCAEKDLAIAHAMTKKPALRVLFTVGKYKICK